jgi:phosphoribosylamine--glycine ligase
LKVLVIGKGGREHAIAWKLAQSAKVTEVLSTPRNPGIAAFGTCYGVPDDDIPGLVALAEKCHADLTVVGPEVPLSLGIVNAFRDKGLKIFGPTREAARIESSKGFAKNLMAKCKVPTAAFRAFSSPDGVENYIRSFKVPPVIKADGLAAGKGVIVAQTHDEAVIEAMAMLKSAKFGTAGASIVIEERMSGQEASIFALCDGKNFKTFLPAQDHKRAFDNDQGPNTGGMGAYAPARIITREIQKEIDAKILAPMIAGMAEEGCPYSGILFAGIMLTESGPKVVEFNCRFGDPETQVILPLFDGDLPEACLASVNGTVDKFELKSKSGTAVCVVLASGGYPDAYEKGKRITGIAEAEKAGAIVFQAGTKSVAQDLLTDGGRVLGVVKLDADLRTAIDGAYRAVDKIQFEKMTHRKDIGKKGL